MVKNLQIDQNRSSPRLHVQTSLSNTSILPSAQIIQNTIYHNDADSHKLSLSSEQSSFLHYENIGFYRSVIFLKSVLRMFLEGVHLALISVHLVHLKLIH